MTEREIFVGAFERHDPDDRDRFLTEACGPDASLRGRVERLLGLAADTSDFLDTRAGPGRVGIPDSGPAAGAVVGGRYRLLEEIGEGGMGSVWRAEQQEPVRREVALKLLKPGADASSVHARFEAERQALALMNHPNIATILDAGVGPDGRPYFAMELVRGVPVTRFCDDHRLTVRDRLGLFVQVCRAVQHAHQKSVVHRDLKPSNVLVAVIDERPVPKVIDFGIAKATGRPLTDDPLVTQPGGVVGTPEYMSPEQAELSSPDVDTRADVYSLGVLLYELLTGTTPLDRDRVKDSSLLEVLRAVREEDPPRPTDRLAAARDLPAVAAARGADPRQLRRQVRGELDWVVMTCLEKDRARRYESAGDLAGDVERYLADEPVRACPPAAGYRVRKFVRRNRAAVAAAVAVAVALTAGTVVSVVLAVRAVRAEGLAGARLASETAERERAVRAEAEGKRQLVAAKLAQARAGRRSRQPGQRTEGLAALTEAARLAHELNLDESQFRALRDEMVACLALADVRPVREWPGLPPGSVDRVGFDADFERYARSDYRGTIEVRQVAGDRLLARLPGRGPAGEMRGALLLGFSPDGRFLAVTNRHRIPGTPTNCQVWDWRNERVVLEPPLPTAGEATVDFSPDGRRLAVCLDGGTVAVYRTDGWQEVARLETGFPAGQVAFHPDGNRLAVADGGGGNVQVWDAGAGKIVRQMSVPPGDDPGGTPLYCVRWHPTGTVLAAGCENRNVYLWDATTGHPHATLRGHAAAVVGVNFTAGGDFLVSTGWDDTTRLWNPWTGQELIQFPGDTRHVSRDGRRLATRAAVHLTIREVDPARERLTIPSGTRVTAWDTSPDGRWLVGGESRVLVWDLARAEEVGSLPGTSTDGVRFHPRGRELFTCGSDGLYRWSFELAGADLRVRPTGRLMPPDRLIGSSLDREGNRLAVAGEGSFVVLDLSDPGGRRRGFRHPRMVSVALSPDGRWAASATHNGRGVNVWDVPSGKLEKELIPDARITRAGFSPDGRWLVTATGMEFEIWEVGTWRPVRQFAVDQAGDGAHVLAFDPDGAVLALAVSPTTVLLIETATWRPLVRLSETDSTQIRRIGFTPDGGRLLVSTRTGAVRVWDLRRVREQLVMAGLDWDRPAYMPVPPVDSARVRVNVDVAAYERLAKP